VADQRHPGSLEDRGRADGAGPGSLPPAERPGQCGDPGEGRADRHGIALQVDIDPQLGELVGDERKVKQVVLNLLANAVKFTPEGGRISLTARRRDGLVEIAVTDTGVGIAPEDQAAIFEEFRQVGSDARKQEGTGLGLTLAKKFVELHGGRIWVESAVSRGATFTFTLPMT